MKTIATAIFNSGLKALDPEACVHRGLRRAGDDLRVAQTAYCLDKIDKLYLIGAG